VNGTPSGVLFFGLNQSSAVKVAGDDALPKFRFAGDAMHRQLRENFLRCRFAHVVFGIGRELRAHETGDLPASPSAPASLFAPGFIHSVREVLEVDPGVADENVGWGMMEKPSHRRVGQRPLPKHRFASGEIRTERSIQLKDCPRGETSLPQTLRVR